MAPIDSATAADAASAFVGSSAKRPHRLAQPLFSLVARPGRLKATPELRGSCHSDGAQTSLCENVHAFTKIFVIFVKFSG